jgi:hypothetical protein
VFCALLLLAISVFVIRFGRNRKYLPVGWFWFVGTLIPVIGLIQSGAQAYADRYTYIPSIGIFIIISWGAAEIFAKTAYRKYVTMAVWAVVLIAMAATTRVQVGYWRNDKALYGHTLAVTKDNYLMHHNYGMLLCEEKKFSEAMQHFEEALLIRPRAHVLPQ